MKGAKRERELAELLRKDGAIVIRCAGSGLNKKAEPDLIVIPRFAPICAVEVKSRNDILYLRCSEGEYLKRLKEYGVNVKIAYRKNFKKWKFFDLEDLRKTEKGYTLNDNEIEERGKDKLF